MNRSVVVADPIVPGNTPDQPILMLLDRDIAVFDRIAVPRELLILAGVQRVTDKEARNKYGITSYGDMSGMVFPYVDPRNGQRTTARIRRDNPEIEGGQPKRKYVSPYQDRRHLYFPPGCAEQLGDPTIPLILVEAEKSALALTAFAQRLNRKYLPIAMGGCWSWRGRKGKIENHRGERVDEIGPLPDLAVAGPGREVIILLDTNAATNPSVQRARRALHSQLIKQGAVVFIADLPAAEGVNGPDELYRGLGRPRDGGCSGRCMCNQEHGWPYDKISGFVTAAGTG